MQRKIQIMFCCVFFVVISSFGVATLDNHREYDYNEGRALTLFPQLDYKKFNDVEYLNTITSAFADQISFRNKLISTYFLLQYKVGQQSYLESTVIGKDEQLFFEPELIIDEEAHQKEVLACAAEVNKLAEELEKQGTRLIYINYPRKDIVMNEYLPLYYPDGEEQYKKDIEEIKKQLNSQIIFIDALDVFEENGIKDPYYQTDHHVNIRGTQLIYEEVLNQINNNAIHEYSLKDYTISEEIVTGSFARRIGNIIEQEPEELKAELNVPITYEHYEDGILVEEGLFVDKGAYASYMGGDRAETKVYNKSVENDVSILLTGSSYTNLLEYLIVPSVEKMMSVDYRHNITGKSIAEYAEEEKIDYVIYIPNQSDDNFNLETFKQHAGNK